MDKVLIEREPPYKYTDDGRELECKLEQAIAPIFNEFVKKGYSPYQISAVAYDAVANKTRSFR